MKTTKPLFSDTCPCRYSNMKHLAAYLLLGLGGNSSPSADDIKAVLDSVGIEADDDRLEKLLSELKGKDINEVWKGRRATFWFGGREVSGLTLHT